MRALSPQVQLHAQMQRLLSAKQRLEHRARLTFRTRREQTRQFDAQLKALSPLSVLERGFSITRRQSGALVRSAKEVQPDEVIETVLRDGSVQSKVLPK